MTEKRIELLEFLSGLLFKCWVMGFGVLLIWLAVVVLGAANHSFGTWANVWSDGS